MGKDTHGVTMLIQRNSKHKQFPCLFIEAMENREQHQVFSQKGLMMDLSEKRGQFLVDSFDVVNGYRQFDLLSTVSQNTFA